MGTGEKSTEKKSSKPRSPKDGLRGETLAVAVAGGGEKGGG